MISSPVRSFPSVGALYIAGLMGVILSAGCAVSKTAGRHGKMPLSVSSLRFLDLYEFPYHTTYKNTWVGGLSGIDYDSSSDRYYIISDERSATSPSRFYTAGINISHEQIDTLIFTSVHTLKRPDQTPFPSLKTDPVNAADPESIRFNIRSNTLVWASEGDKAYRNGKEVVRDPWVWEMTTGGRYLRSFILPGNLHMQATDKGPRLNGVFEGLSFGGNNNRMLYVSVEEPLLEDGPRASPGYAGAPVRIIAYNTRTRKPLAQYAYRLDAVAGQPHPESAFYVNGISEILYIGENRLLVLERSFSTGIPGCTIKIFLADLSQATDVRTQSGLHLKKEVQPAQKKLLFNLDSLQMYIDNVEGITLGPRLPNGHYSLLLMADNNFNNTERNQLFLFEVIP